MIKNFDSIKTQLKEVADIINLFKSEAVQLRIVDRLLGKSVSEDDSTSIRNDPVVTLSPTKRKRKIKDKGGSNSELDGDQVKKPRSVNGPKSVIDQLIADGFFSKPKTMSEILIHCSHKLAKVFKTSDMSPTLIRAVRNQNLKRDKKDDQYVYFVG